MKRFIPYITFVATYGGLLLLAGLAARAVDAGALDFISVWIAPVVAAPIALLLAKRSGQPTRLGIGVSALAFAACICIATVGIFIIIAVPTGVLTVVQALGMFPTYFSLGGWTLLLSYLLVIAAPLPWSVFFLPPRVPAGA